MIIERDLLAPVRASLANDAVVVVVGARQTGKTTLVRQLFHEMEEARKRCFFINLERLDFVALLNASPENLFRIIPPLGEGGTVTVFIDEIQYLDNPTNFLKYLYDEHRGRLKLVVTGSSAFYIDEKFTDSLAGRKRIFELHTLNFREFLRFRGRADIRELFPARFEPENFERLAQFPRIHQDDLLKLFGEYACFGGYPRVVLAEDFEEKRFILEDLVNSNAKKDIFEAKLRYPERYFDLMKILAVQAGGLVNRNELARTLQVSIQAVENYLYVMRKSFHIALVRSFHGNVRKELTKMPKVYFYDMGIRNYLSGNFSDFALRQDKGTFLENLVFKQLSGSFPIDDIQFWRTQDKNELDFVVQGRYGFEAKASPSAFLPSRYENFKKRNPDIFVDVVTYDAFRSNDGYRVWPAWGI